MNEQNPHNEPLLAHYFFIQFTHSPQGFYDFLFFLDKNLRSRTHLVIRRKIASYYLHILSPLCERFGFYERKNILDDIAFYLVYPKKYLEISRILRQYKIKSRMITRKIFVVLEDLLKTNHYSFILKGRYKTVYSTYVKLKKKPRKTVLQLNDIFAFRIILKNNSIDECFALLNQLHDRFSPVTDFFKDYITIPKINGYQSLHTGINNVIDELDLPIEVQIRTQSMHDFSEKGVAAHWVYKTSKYFNSSLRKEKQLYEYFLSFSHTPLDQFVYCFSYKGDIFTLRRGETVHDFAYMIHSDLGSNAKYAFVNNEKMPLLHIIQDGDRIKVMQ